MSPIDDKHFQKIRYVKVRRRAVHHPARSFIEAGS
jgi:hypothetical protein